MIDETNHKRIDLLTPQEIVVLKLIANGLRDKDIANELTVSVNTIRTSVVSSPSSTSRLALKLLDGTGSMKTS